MKGGKMKKIKMVKDYFTSYCMENNVNGDDIERLLDILYAETIEYFGNYETFYNYFTSEF